MKKTTHRPQWIQHITRLQERRSIFFLLGHSIYLCLVLVFPFILTYAIESENDYARLAVYLNLLVILFEFSNLGLSRGLQQLAIQSPLDDLKKRLALPLQAAIGLIATVSAILVSLTLLTYTLCPQVFEHNPWIAFWFWLAVELGLTRLCVSGLLYGTRRYGWYIALDIGWAALRIAIVPALWLMAGMSGALAGLGLIWLLTMLPGAWLLWRMGYRPARGRWTEAFGKLQYYLRLGFWMHLSSQMGNLVRPAVVLLLALVIGRDHPDTGYAHLALSLFIPAAVLLDSLFMSLYPEKARLGVQGHGATLRRWAFEESLALGFLLWPPAVAALMLAEPAVTHLLKPGYHDLTGWIGPIVLALPARAMATPLIVALQANHRPLNGAAFQGMRLVLDLTCLWLVVALLPRLGPNGAAWGIFAGEWLATLIIIKMYAAPPARKNPLEEPSRLSAWPSLILIALMAVWGLGQMNAPAVASKWLVWLGLSAIWFGVMPLTPLASWRHVRELFHPAKKATN